ncbi:MAG: DUF4038 domain-containing protein, partial [Acidobacteria bacterium]|nr:DUF4038 domain-containing protein [Acidobacteriota bacterium]
KSTPVYQPCDIEFELTEQEAARHPNPHLSVELRAEFRAPKGNTYRLPAFWDGGRKFKIRFSPLAEGNWDFRVSSNIDRFSGKMASFTATAPTTPGYVSPFNVHHFRYSQENTPHLWMGDTRHDFAVMPMEEFRRLADLRAAQKFNHLRGLVLGDEATAKRVFADPERIPPEHFQNLDERIRYLNQKGIAADLVLGAGQGQLEKLLPNWKQRERYLRYLVARYAAMNVTWQGVEAYEEYENGPALLKEIADLLKQVDPYRHPRATHSTSTSAPLASAGWLDYATCQSTETNLFAVEHQFYPLPFVNLGSPGADPDTARKRLWNAAINGQYVTLGEAPLDSAAAQQATHLYTFFAQTRYWDLEPYFRIEGARALALEEVEYIVYLEKPGPVELMVHKAGYEVSWFNPITGAWVDDANFKGERYTVGNPPDASHDWVLYVRREGKKQGMNRSYKFESRTPVMQPLEVSKKEVPFSIQLPEESELKVDQKYEFNATLLKPSRATRNMIWLWTGEVPSSFLGYKVLGTTQFGTFLIPPGLTRDYPTTLQVRLYGLDGNGKLFASDKVYTLKK